MFKRSTSVVFFHGLVPDYRIPLYSGVANGLPEVKVFAGQDYFGLGFSNAGPGNPWFFQVKNVYFFGRRLMLQFGGFTTAVNAGVAVMEYNPRILNIVAVAFLRKLLGRPVVWWGHVDSSRGAGIHNLPRQILLGLGVGFVAYTDAQRKKLISSGYTQFIEVTNNSCLSRADIRSSTGGGRDFIYVGRLVREKKVELLIQGFAEALASGLIIPDSLLYVVGAGPEAAQLKEVVAKLGIVENVVFTGHISDVERLRALYAPCLAAVSPGYVGLSVIQAFGMGKIMVVADREPHSPEIEACRPGHNTIFFPSDSVVGLAKCLGEIQRDRVFWTNRARLIADEVSRKYTYEAMVDALRNAISQAKELERSAL